jgi:hypothetical protein
MYSILHTKICNTSPSTHSATQNIDVSLRCISTKKKKKKFENILGPRNEWSTIIRILERLDTGTNSKRFSRIPES